tara:strand:+ start:570 stop:764 length:195 start_codon:yes stop_codon:yes gene_type:complete
MNENFCITYSIGSSLHKIEFNNEEEYNTFINSDKINLLNNKEVTNVVFHCGNSTFSLNELIGVY